MRLRPGLHPTPRCMGSLQRFPRPLAGFKGREKGRKGVGREEEGKGKGEEGLGWGEEREVGTGTSIG